MVFGGVDFKLESEEATPFDELCKDDFFGSLSNKLFTTYVLPKMVSGFPQKRPKYRRNVSDGLSQKFVMPIMQGISKIDL
jgi:hypothetical protein